MPAPSAKNKLRTFGINMPLMGKVLVLEHNWRSHNSKGLFQMNFLGTIS